MGNIDAALRQEHRHAEKVHAKARCGSSSPTGRAKAARAFQNELTARYKRIALTLARYPKSSRAPKIKREMVEIEHLCKVTWGEEMKQRLAELRGKKR